MSMSVEDLREVLQGVPGGMDVQLVVSKLGADYSLDPPRRGLLSEVCKDIEMRQKHGRIWLRAVTE